MHNNKIKNSLCYISLLGISLLVTINIGAMEKDDPTPSNKGNVDTSNMVTPNTDSISSNTTNSIKANQEVTTNGSNEKGNDISEKTDDALTKDTNTNNMPKTSDATPNITKNIILVFEQVDGGPDNGSSNTIPIRGKILSNNPKSEPDKTNKPTTVSDKKRERSNSLPDDSSLNDSKARLSNANGIHAKKEVIANKNMQEPFEKNKSTTSTRKNFRPIMLPEEEDKAVENNPEMQGILASARAKEQEEEQEKISTNNTPASNKNEKKPQNHFYPEKEKSRIPDLPDSFWKGKDKPYIIKEIHDQEEKEYKKELPEKKAKLHAENRDKLGLSKNNPKTKAAASSDAKEPSDAKKPTNWASPIDPKKPTASDEDLKRAQIRDIENRITINKARQGLEEAQHVLAEDQAVLYKEKFFHELLQSQERFKMDKETHELNKQTAHNQNSIWYGCKRQFGQQFFGTLGGGLGNGAAQLSIYLAIKGWDIFHNKYLISPEEKAETDKLNALEKKVKMQISFANMHLNEKLVHLSMQETEVKKLNLSNLAAAERHTKLENTRTRLNSVASMINDEGKERANKLLKESEINEFLTSFVSLREAQGLSTDPLKELQVQLHNGTLLKKNKTDPSLDNRPRLTAPIQKNTGESTTLNNKNEPMTNKIDSSLLDNRPRLIVPPTTQP
jgi:hypothetical protein